uniref:Beta-microseminoprotein-like n=1 Tax=Scleropages formosus TaxID=113540 RepID=A0A8C9V6V5_SCLFO
CPRVLQPKVIFKPVTLTSKEQCIVKTPTGVCSGCLDSEGKMHKFGSQWVTPNCLDCSCSTEAIRCCTMIPTVVSMPPRCKMLVNEKSCTYEIVMKANPNLPCVLKGNGSIALVNKK